MQMMSQDPQPNETSEEEMPIRLLLQVLICKIDGIEAALSSLRSYNLWEWGY